MRSSITIASLIAFAHLQPANAQPSSFKTLVEKEFATFPNHAEIAIAIIDRDSTYHMGYRLENGGLQPVKNESTLFEIGSITKVFTSALLMKEVKRNTIALDDPLQKHLPFRIKQGAYNNRSITMLHLVTHTSGLKKNPLMSYQRYCKYLKSFDLSYTPGKKWEYNNLAVGLVGELTAEKNKTSWDISLTENLLKPLHMNNTYASVQEAPKTNRVQCVGKDGTKGDCYFHKMRTFQWSDGGMISTLHDMATWLKANLGSAQLPSDLDFIGSAHDALADTIQIPWFAKYNATQGIGWWHYRTDAKRRIICHGGNMPAQTSFIAFDKERRRGVVILTNVSGKAILNDDKILKTTALGIRVLEF